MEDVGFLNQCGSEQSTLFRRLLDVGVVSHDFAGAPRDDGHCPVTVVFPTHLRASFQARCQTLPGETAGTIAKP